jgi:hypothetical protein
VNRLRTRLERLERQRPTDGRLTFEEVWEQYERLWAWLETKGYADCLAALEAGESGPEGLEALLREQASCDTRRRAWERILAALDAHQLPDDEDKRLHAIPEQQPLRETRK